MYAYQIRILIVTIIDMKQYSSELSVQYLVALLKAHNIKRVIASPGTTALSFVASMQCDPFFEMYSCVDERSAAYMAVGLAAETNEPVVITCTGATASRNYLPALTEAYYRKLPILAVTGTQYEGRIGDLHSQLIDRSSIQKDVAVLSVHIPGLVETSSFEEKRHAQVEMNRAITALTRHGGGPVHINLQTLYSWDFSVAKLPEVKMVRRMTYGTVEQFPEMPEGRIAIFVGSHNTFNQELTDAIDTFCASRNAVVFCDHTSGYYGKYKVNFSLEAVQETYTSPLTKMDLCIHIGEISAEYGSVGMPKKEVWRVSEDGEIRDQFNALSYIFEMTESDFFRFYTIENAEPQEEYLKACHEEYDRIFSRMPEMGFTNIWAASMIAPKLPNGSSLHLGILNSVRSWNLFQIPKSVTSFANVGGFGIDGSISTVIGASLANKNKLYFCIVGDLAFFYDMNSLGNRHVGNNVRLLIVNNGRGTEFRNFYHVGSTFGDDADAYIAAAGHYGVQSKNLVKNYTQDLGYEYLSASTKEEFLSVYNRFVTPEITQKPMVLEIFTDSEDESNTLKRIWNIETTQSGALKNNVRKLAIKLYQTSLGNTIMKILGKSGLSIVRKMLSK